LSSAAITGANLDADAPAQTQQRVLSETRLQSIIEKHRLYPGVPSP